MSLRNTDWHLDRLYDFLPDLGVTLVQAAFSRYVIDPNRPLSAGLLGRQTTHPIAITNTWGEPIYSEVPTQEDLRQRVRLYYEPYHSQLNAILCNLRGRHGDLLLLDLHSFMGPLKEDVCLGNGRGQTSSHGTLLRVASAFTEHGFVTALNDTYTGGHIVRHYPGVIPGLQAVQIELRYTQYLKSDQLDRTEPPSPDVPELQTAKKRLISVFSTLFERNWMAAR